MNGLDYIEAHLGYRYVITGTSLSYDAQKSDTAAFSLTIQNTGFAPSYRCFDGTMILHDTATGIRISIPVSLDVRTIKAGGKSTFTFPLAVRALPEGTYEMSFCLTDPYTKRAIRFANDTAKEDGLVPTGTLIILPTSDGAAWEDFWKALPSLFFGS